MQYKRTQRAMPDETKQKISTALKGRKKSFSHKLHISKGMEKYWSQIPPSVSDSGTTMSDLLK